MTSPYSVAQRAIGELKEAVLEVLRSGPPQGMKNAEIGRSLGIHSGYDARNRQEGHVTRTLLAYLEKERLVEQDPFTKRWRPVTK